MSIIPPHLPPPTCNIVQHKKWQRIKIILLSTFFGLFAGMSGAAILLGWVWPKISENQIFFSSYIRRASVTKPQLDFQTKLEISGRQVALYKASSKENNLSYLDANNLLGYAAVISSDGWVVFPLTGKDDNYKSWLAVINDGKISQISSSTVDKIAGYVYLKIQGDSFRSIRFASEPIVDQEIFVFEQNDWRNSSIVSKAYESTLLPHPDCAPISIFRLNDKFIFGSMAVNNSGDLVGYIGNSGQLVPASRIQATQFLNTATIQYNTMAVDGWFNQERIIFFGQNTVDGFYVSRNASSSSGLKKGDIITEIEGKIATPENLWYNLNSKSKVNLVVLREGKKIDFPVSVFIKKFN